MQYQVLLFYKYVPLEDPQALATRIKSLAEPLGLRGRVIVAGEGLNATLEGERAKTEDFVRELLADERFADMNIKRSRGDGRTFPKLSVKVRKEIVGTHFPDEEANPLRMTGTRLSPDALHRWYQEGEDFVVVDMRNDYEYASGHFAGSVDPGLRASRDLPHALAKLEDLKEKKVVTVCTGGVRCEKMSSYLMHKGFKKVYQLENGIHAYMEKYPDGAFKGTLYTFDNRITMDFGGNREVVGRCRLCGLATEQYVNCRRDECHLHFLACDACRVPGEAAPYCSSDCAALKRTVAS